MCLVFQVCGSLELCDCQTLCAIAYILIHAQSKSARSELGHNAIVDLVQFFTIKVVRNRRKKGLDKSSNSSYNLCV